MRKTDRQREDCVHAHIIMYFQYNQQILLPWTHLLINVLEFLFKIVSIDTKLSMLKLACTLYEQQVFIGHVR